jgi:hypothetical protein
MRVKTPCTWRIKASPSKSIKISAGKKRTCSEAEGSAPESSPPSTPCPNPTKEWKKAKPKTENLLALVNNGFLREKENDLWCAATGDPYPMEKIRTRSPCLPDLQSVDWHCPPVTSSRAYSGTTASSTSI